ncbi:DNA cytosine methyltransferase [Halomonas sp. OfavH-34-E]|uniref:DNA cytosine methyltransferase n=1 Tax=Halomonas sp. OfavH-34-E TaxID=2954491 RepID=UPI002097318E|nr:DNA cytosine methyltransferase [Halomonas sp. OfavH-34-E]MCO7218089.1 DNA cytosine methyltransferase [Halomonas sp. OfavH-34-E]
MTSLNLFGHELVVDNFAGGGGASEGIEQALGRPVDLAINHDATAIAVHTANHPGSEHSVADVWDIDPETAAAGRPVGLAWFSPDCRHHSKAKGGRPVSKSVRGLAWVAARWAAKVKPRVIALENVEEFLDWGPLIKNAKGQLVPDPARKGQTFNGFVRALRRHGYQVDWGILKACDFGAPTIRRRLFLVARRDGLPITWPKPTHGDPGSPAVRRGKLQPWRTAAECIDWSIPCPSIFERQRPLADATLRRIAKGVMRYVVKSGEPFIVKANHTASWYNAFRGQSLHDPLQTVTVSPGFAVVSPTLIQTGYGERVGQAPRVLDTHRPLGTVVAGGQKHALVSAFLCKHYTGVVGDDLRKPLPTITATDHNAPVAVSLVNLKGSERGGRDPRQPMPTICAGGTHAAAVAAFLVKYYGQGVGQVMNDPMHTMPTKDRFGLVTVTIAGEQYAIVDIGMRMLQPHELAAAQGFPDHYEFAQVNGKPVPKYQQVRLIGNSVCPPLAKAIVEANFTHERRFMPATEQGEAA